MTRSFALGKHSHNRDTRNTDTEDMRSSSERYLTTKGNHNSRRKSKTADARESRWWWGHAASRKMHPMGPAERSAL